jgi:hypothetical protein
LYFEATCYRPTVSRATIMEFNPTAFLLLERQQRN